MPEEPIEPVEDDLEEPTEGEPTEGEPEEGETDPNEGLSEAEVKEAHNLYKLLRDKSQSKNVIRVLAQQAGLLEASTKAEVKEARKDMKALVREKLGKDYEFLADKLGDVIEAALESERQSVNERLGTVAQKEVERETSTALDRLSRETKGESRKLEDRMIQLMDRIKPSNDLSVYEYLKDLYTLASSGKSAASTKAQIADKIRRNSGNAAERLQSKTSTSKGGTATGPEKKGLRASVEYAMEQMGLKK